MNAFIQAVKKRELATVERLLQKNPDWIHWSEESGKNALHYLCGGMVKTDPQRAEASLNMLKLLLAKGMQINAVHRIADECGFFPATPLWYAYAKGRNEAVYMYLLEQGADPNHCLFAIAWNDDVKAANLFTSYGAQRTDANGNDEPFLAAFLWKRFAITRWLLETGADVNYADADGNTALFYGIKRKYKLDDLRILLEFGADFDRENKAGMSPRMLAQQNNQTGVLRLEKQLRSVEEGAVAQRLR